MPQGNTDNTVLTHIMELEIPCWSDLDRSFLLQSIPCQVLGSQCYCGSEDSNRKCPVDFTRHWSNGDTTQTGQKWIRFPRHPKNSDGLVGDKATQSSVGLRPNTKGGSGVRGWLWESGFDKLISSEEAFFSLKYLHFKSSQEHLWASTLVLPMRSLHRSNIQGLARPNSHKFWAN